MSEPPDVTPESLRHAMAELRKAPTFADLLDKYPMLEHLAHEYVLLKQRGKHAHTARARLNAEAERAGLEWR